MSYTAYLFVYFILSHSVSFVCSILESSLLSCTPSYASTLAKINPKRGESLKRLKSSIYKPLAAILTFNTASHTFGAAGIGAMVEVLYGDAYLTIASIIITLTMLYLTEMIPKTIGSLYWKSLLPFCIPLIEIMMKISYPFVFSFGMVSKLFGRAELFTEVDEEEIKTLIEEGALLGVFEDLEKKIVFRVFHIADSKGNDFMVNRKDVFWIDCESSKEEFKDKISKKKSGVYFIYKGNPDNPVGYVKDSDILYQLISKEEFDLNKIKKSPLFVPENINGVFLLETLEKNRESIAFLVDEYGGVVGVVSREDIFNELVKDVVSLFLLKKQLITKTSETSWEVDGALSINDFMEIFLVDISEKTYKFGYHTLAGFCLTQLEGIPSVGDDFFYLNYRFKIIEMSKNRISRVLISKSHHKTN